MNGFGAVDLANIIEGSLGLIENVFAVFSEGVKDALVVQTIGGRNRKLQDMNNKRAFGVEFNQSFITPLSSWDNTTPFTNAK